MGDSIFQEQRKAEPEVRHSYSTNRRPDVERFRTRQDRAREKRTIVAYGMFDSDLQAIRDMMSKAGLKKELDGDGYTFGEIYEDDIERILDEKRVVLKVLDHEFPIETPGRRVTKRTRHVLSDTMDRLGIVPEFLPSRKETKFYIVQLSGSLFQEWLKKLEELEVFLLQFFPVNSYLAELTDYQSNKVGQLSFVNLVRLFVQDDKGIFISSETREYIHNFNPSSTHSNHKKFRFDIIVHVASDLEGVRRWLKRHRAKIDHYRDRKICVTLDADDVGIILKMTELPEIQVIEEYVRPQLFSGNQEYNF
jgi:hypothetical protein